MRKKGKVFFLDFGHPNVHMSNFLGCCSKLLVLQIVFNVLYWFTMLEDKDKVVLLQAHKQIQIFGHLNFKEAYAGVTTTSTSNNPSLDLDDDDNDNDC